MATGTGISNYAELKILDHMLGTASWTKPTAVYMALSTTEPATDESFSELANANGYARQVIAFDAAASGAAANTDSVTFGPNTASNWGTVASFALFDSGTVGAGNMICYGALSSPVALAVGDKLEFAVGAVMINLD